MGDVFEAVGRLVSKVPWKAVGTVCLFLIGGATIMKGVADSQVKSQMIEAAVSRQLADAISKAAQNHH